MTFKEGDKVWHFLYGWGVVTEIRTPIGVEYPVAALFGNTVLVFTQCGVGYAGQNQVLFHDELKFLVPPEPKREVVFNITTAFTHEWKTAAGLSVRLYATDTGGRHPVHGAVNYNTAAGWISECWTVSGKYLEVCEHDTDLVHSPSCGCLG